MNLDNIVIEFEVDNAKLISVNDQYMHPVRKTKRGRYISYFAPTPYLKEVQAFYSEELKDKFPEDKLELMRQLVERGVEIYLEIIVGGSRTSIRDNDVSNFIKSIEDCIVKRTGIDDKHHYSVKATKALYETEDDHWIVHIKMSPMLPRSYEDVVSGKYEEFKLLKEVN